MEVEWRWSGGGVDKLDRFKGLQSTELPCVVDNLTKGIFDVQDVPMNILQDQVCLNIHSKAGVFKYILMEIPFQASVEEYV